MEIISVIFYIVILLNLTMFYIYVRSSKRVIEKQNEIINKWADRYFKLGKEKDILEDKYYELKNKKEN